MNYTRKSKSGSRELINGYIQQENLSCDSCKICESDRCALLILAESKNNQIHEFYDKCKTAFSVERNHYLVYYLYMRCQLF